MLTDAKAGGDLSKRPTFPASLFVLRRNVIGFALGIGVGFVGEVSGPVREIDRLFSIVIEFLDVVLDVGEIGIDLPLLACVSLRPSVLTEAKGTSGWA